MIRSVFAKVNPGDTVTFLPTDNIVERIKDMIPDGAEPFKSKMNETYKVTFDVPGATASNAPRMSVRAWSASLSSAMRPPMSRR